MLGGGDFIDGFSPIKRSNGEAENPLNRNQRAYVPPVPIVAFVRTLGRFAGAASFRAKSRVQTLLR